MDPWLKVCRISSLKQSCDAGLSMELLSLIWVGFYLDAAVAERSGGRRLRVRHRGQEH